MSRTGIRKLTIFAALCVPLAVGTVWLIRASSKPRASEAAPPSAASPQNTAASAESRDHELKMLTKELEKKPGHVPVLMRMAQLARESGNSTEAAARLQQALKTEPDNTDVLIELGRVLYESGDVTGAIVQTSKVLEKNPNHVDALYNLGAIFANTGNPAKAKTYWEQAKAANPASESGQKAAQGLQSLMR